MAMSSITHGKRPPWPVTSTFTEKLWELTQHCWDHDPELRPEALEVLEVLLTTLVLHLLHRSSCHRFDYILARRDLPTWKRLTSSHLSPDEHLALISSTFSDPGGVEAVMQLSADDAQAFVDVTDEVNLPAISYLKAV